MKLAADFTRLLMKDLEAYPCEWCRIRIFEDHAYKCRHCGKSHDSRVQRRRAKEEPKDVKKKILAEIVAEREVQDRKWGGPSHDDCHDEQDWVAYIRDHNNKACGPETFRKQMIRVAALAVAAIESFDRHATADRRRSDKGDASG